MQCTARYIVRLKSLVKYSPFSHASFAIWSSTEADNPGDSWLELPLAIDMIVREKKTITKLHGNTNDLCSQGCKMPAIMAVFMTHYVEQYLKCHCRTFTANICYPPRDAGSNSKTILRLCCRDFTRHCTSMSNCHHYCEVVAPLGKPSTAY